VTNLNKKINNAIHVQLALFAFKLDLFAQKIMKMT